jgi:DNA-binding IclR family transcriptional regulator
MSDFKPRPGTFLPYLEAENKRQEQRPKASPLTLLEILTRQSGRALLIFELQAKSGIEPARYGEALKSLRNAGYIDLEGEALEETIRLTHRGVEVERLAQPV